ncbi:hypothetical protein J4447_00790 [Candidatus Pacearchaeota archaeon]|nr:hypothetical protein [Candidatus Pacearchaeota archaeon]
MSDVLFYIIAGVGALSALKFFPSEIKNAIYETKLWKRKQEKDQGS